MTTSTLTLEVHVAGEPVPQGSMIAIRRGRITQVVPDNATELARWRGAVTKAAQARMRLTGWLTLDQATRVDLTFRLARPAAARRREHPHVRPDLDKLARAVGDALTAAQVWSDDSRCVELIARKVYADDGRGPGVIIRVEPMTEGLL